MECKDVLKKQKMVGLDSDGEVFTGGGCGLTAEVLLLYD